MNALEKIKQLGKRFVGMNRVIMNKKEIIQEMQQQLFQSFDKGGISLALNAMMEDVDLLRI